MKTLIISRGVPGGTDPLRCFWDKYVLWLVRPGRVNVARIAGEYDTYADAEKALLVAGGRVGVPDFIPAKGELPWHYFDDDMKEARRGQERKHRGDHSSARGDVRGKRA